jgi:hypothetical protein
LAAPVLLLYLPLAVASAGCGHQPGLMVEPRKITMKSTVKRVRINAPAQ